MTDPFKMVRLKPGTFEPDVSGETAQFDPDSDFVLCTRVADIAQPHVPSAQVSCTRCGELVWAAVQSSMPLIEAGGTVVCMQCMANIEDPDKEFFSR